MVTIYLFGFVIGPLFLAPLSELYGRYIVSVLANAFMCVWLLGCALTPTMSGLIVMRLLAGIGGSGAMVIAPAVVADIYPLERRAFATATIVLAQCCGPALGPVMGGFIAYEIGWRWVG
jgi:MFS family permease